MTGRIVHVPPPARRCERQGGCQDKPPTESLRPGTIWQCDECGKKWVVVHGAQYNETYAAWRPLTESNRDGRDR